MSAPASSVSTKTERSRLAPRSCASRRLVVWRFAPERSTSVRSCTRLNSLLRLGLCDEAAREDGDHCDPDVRGKEIRRAVVHDVEPAIEAEPSEQPLNGLITNGKFCLTRTLRLRLSWPRARDRLRSAALPQLRGGPPYHGEEHAATAARLAQPAHGRADGDRPAALGPGLAASPAVGNGSLARSGRGAGATDPAGDAPCA